MKQSNLIKRILILIIIFGLVQPIFLVSLTFAQTSPNSSPSAIQADLQRQLDEVERQIAEYQKQLAVTVTQKNTLANKIKQLRVKQQELNALIKQTTLKVQTLTGKITDAETDLKTNLAKAVELEAEMAGVIQQIHQKDLRPIILLASANGLSNAFTEVWNYSKININLKYLVDALQILKKQIEDKKDLLQEQKFAAVDLLQLKSAQNRELVNNLTEQNNLLTKTKGVEASYASQLADKKKQAAEIRTRIYSLFNTGSQINFGQAVDIANWASKLTGVRPAFLLAILTQESNLGKNVGTCNRAGDPVEKSWKVIMKPERDQEPFKKITAELGLDIDTTPVSCPMRGKDGKQIGWGGAMGPAQFIPSTWMGYRNKVTALTGKSNANPWDIRDAFIASGVKLKNDGAGTEAGEWKAAMIYFSGSTNPTYRFYGDNVIAIAKKYQQDIDQLSN